MGVFTVMEGKTFSASLEPEAGGEVEDEGFVAGADGDEGGDVGGDEFAGEFDDFGFVDGADNVGD